MRHTHSTPTGPGMRRREKATAYVAAMLCMAAMAGLTVPFIALITSQNAAALAKRQSARAYYIAEAGLNAALGELNADQDYIGDGLDRVVGSFGGGGYEVTAVENAEDDYTLTSIGTYAQRQRAIEAVVQRPSAEISFNALAAITADGPVWTTGSIYVDGRDRSIDGVLTGNPGVWGILCSSTVVRMGASVIGGFYTAPTKDSNVFFENFSWADATDNDGDGAVDEEAYDGIDNDGDGSTDEDVNGYPSGPDVALGLPPGTLKLVAQACNTYFDSQEALTAYIAQNGGNIPGGVIVYLEAEEWLPADFGDNINQVPSLVVMHNEHSNAVLKNLHGQFKGLLLADQIEHVNANAVVLGAIISFADETYGTIYGNGNAYVLFSSEVLANLPANPASSHFLLRSWREVAP